MTPTLALDLDGTLISCAPRHQALMLHACRQDELPPDFIAAYWNAKREGASNLVALRRLGHPEPEARAAAWNRDIEHWPWLGFDRLLPGVESVLRGGRFRIAVLTARREKFFLHQQLDRLALTDRIDELVVVSPATAAAAKGDALRKLRPLAFVGDTESDAEAARLADIPFLALNCGMRSATFWLTRHQPSHADLSTAVASSSA